jgi:hypothetical protein
MQNHKSINDNNTRINSAREKQIEETKKGFKQTDSNEKCSKLKKTSKNQLQDKLSSTNNSTGVLYNGILPTGGRKGSIPLSSVSVKSSTVE